MNATFNALARILLLGVVGVVLTGALALSCRPQKPSGPSLYDSQADLKPDANPGEKAILIFFGSDVPVDVEHRVEGNSVSLRLTAYGEEVELEKYVTESPRFLLAQAASEQYDPPLPLLEFPITEGQKISWKGKLIIGPVDKSATATTVVTKDNLNEKGFSGEAVKSAVVLEFDGGGPKPTTRTLNFWFVPSKGIQKRMFDKGSTRVPYSPRAPEKSEGE